MVEMFNQHKADFRGILETNQKLYVSEVIYKTFIDINEIGTEAAAQCKHITILIIQIIIYLADFIDKLYLIFELSILR